MKKIILAVFLALVFSGTVSHAGVSEPYKPAIGDKIADYLGQWFAAMTDMTIQDHLGKAYIPKEKVSFLVMYGPKEELVIVQILGSVTFPHSLVQFES